MNATNYFKVRGPVGERVFGFATWDRGDIRAAYNRATSCPGRVSVFYRVPLSGPWDSVPAIAPNDAPLPVATRAAALPGARPARAFALFGEGGCL